MKKLVLIIALLLSACSSPSQAMTNKELLENFSDDERFGYITGTIEALAFVAKVNKRQEAATCLTNWFFGEGDGMTEIVNRIHDLPDKAPQATIYVLARKKCGKF
ncbi:hypothetical protein [Sneathiella sp.]|uniref:hypothetical protein n=1 Tax=Sneathiella sp. TaxID=1964365 RepID=UPI0026294CB8|nr:hypothetical protein [Sneathiella sp.]MDF2365640.1 hypothetical protein [Sneathiella sp.]